MLRCTALHSSARDFLSACPTPALDGRTPEALVKAGRASAVREYLDHLALGRASFFQTS